jgi:hypothetical protein
MQMHAPKQSKSQLSGVLGFRNVQFSIRVLDVDCFFQLQTVVEKYCMELVHKVRVCLALVKLAHSPAAPRDILCTRCIMICVL